MFIARGAVERRVDLVVHERRAQDDLPPAVAGRRGKRREVAGQHGRSRHLGERIGRRHVQHRALVRAEEEHPVGDNRTAKRAAELVTLEAVIELLPVRTGRREHRRRIELLVADKLERRTVKGVRAGLGHRIHRAP
jgi:hypothetical protein